ncbi:MAG: hypothetical protein C4536_07350 [Actinobacteria bacterium]|jgi:hypothetical protein|nr:MAG: hypothetical protein C4536_07350 [Actinomycetota bacterium]
MALGWSESYHEDMKREAEQEIGRRVAPLLANIIELREALEKYGDFAGGAGELEDLLARLQELLEEYLQTS